MTPITIFAYAQYITYTFPMSSQKKECVFCTDSQIQQRTIFQNSFVRVFLTNIPIVPGHVLITPIRCITFHEDLTQREREEMHRSMLIVKQALRKIFNATGFNIAWNEGAVAGQSVPHFHIHILPRKQGDSGITQYEPRQFLYRPGSREVSPQNELTAIAISLQQEISQR